MGQQITSLAALQAQAAVVQQQRVLQEACLQTSPPYTTLPPNTITPPAAMNHGLLGINHFGGQSVSPTPPHQPKGMIGLYRRMRNVHLFHLNSTYKFFLNNKSIHLYDTQCQTFLEYQTVLAIHLLSCIYKLKCTYHDHSSNQV